jgi:hypothetical protein
MGTGKSLTFFYSARAGSLACRWFGGTGLFTCPSLLPGSRWVGGGGDKNRPRSPKPSRAGAQGGWVGPADSDLTLKNLTPCYTWEQVGMVAGLVEQT